MKRKLLTLAIVSALSAACIFGATACNKDDGGDESGVPDVGDSIQVADEAAWNAAFDQPASCTMSTTQKASETIDEVTVTSTVKGTGYFVDNEEYLISTMVVNGDENVTYEYILTDGTTSYFAYRKQSEESWKTNALTLTVSDSSVRYPFSAFTFENGEYIGAVVSEELGGVEISYTIKIGSEGYVKYIKEEYNYNGKSMTTESSIYNINSTTYTFPADAKQAVADYKAAHSNN